MTIRALIAAAAFALGAALLPLAPAAAAISLPAATFGGESAYDGDGPWTLGWRFSVSAPVTVTALGVYDLGGDGFQAPHAVGLWDSSNLLVASATVSGGDPLIGGFRYAAVAPGLLAPGLYTLGAADLGAGDGYAYDAASVTTLPGLTYLGSAYASGSGLTFPDQEGFGVSYFGPNLLVVASAVPEPSTWAVMLVGFAGLGGALRLARRRRPFQALSSETVGI